MTSIEPRRRRLVLAGCTTALLSACGGGGDTPAPAAGPTDPAAALRHGDTVTLAGSFGTQDATQTFLGGAGGPVESLAAGATMPDGGGWRFNDLGGPTTVATDPARGKVLFTPEDNTRYNAVRRFDPGAPIAEQRHFYKAHWVRNVLRLDGQPYAKSHQWKHERVSWINSVSDTETEIKVHDWVNGGGGNMTFVNRSATDGSTYYGGPVVASNTGWALMEIIGFTGTQGLADGRVITRVHQDGRTRVGQNRQAERIYVDAARRLRYFIEQNYFGNFGQVEDGVDNALPRPQQRELWSDDSRVIVGNAAGAGAKRVELRDTVDLRTATVRELQAWTTWNGDVTLKLNTGGLAPGQHALHLVVVDGVDADGWDRVVGSRAVTVRVD